MTLTSLVLFCINPILVAALSPLLVGAVRKIKAFMQNRHGASLLQPYRDLAKLFHKDEVIAADASWITYAAPYVVFGTTLVLAAGLPLVSTAITVAPLADLLIFVYTVAAGAFALALAGIDSGGGFGGFGASREMMIAAITEGSFVLSLFVVALLAHSTNFITMTFAVHDITTAHLLPLILAGVAFFVTLLAENARLPIDNPATHLELTMVHEAMLLEYSGKRLALMEWAAANKLLIFSGLLVSIFIPWGVTTTTLVRPLIASTLYFLVKLCGVALLIGVLESVMPKLRLFRLPDLLFTAFVLTVIALIITV